MQPWSPLGAAERFVVPVECQESSLDGESVHAPRKLLSEVNLHLDCLKNVDSFLNHKEEGVCFQHLTCQYISQTFLLYSRGLIK